MRAFAAIASDEARLGLPSQIADLVPHQIPELIPILETEALHRDRLAYHDCNIARLPQYHRGSHDQRPRSDFRGDVSQVGSLG